MKGYVKIILAIILLIALLMGVFFEIKDVPKVKQGESFDVEEKDLGGLMLFYEMLQTYYGVEKVTIIKSDEFGYLEGKTNSLLIIVDNSIYLDSLSQIELLDFSNEENEVLLISGDFEIDDNRHLTTELGFYRNDTIFQMQWSNGDSMTYKPYLNESSVMPYSRISHFDLDSNYNFTSLLTRNDSLTIFQVGALNDHKVYLHSAPMLFQNRSAMSGTYLENFNRTFGNFKSEEVILHQFAHTHLRVGASRDSVLQYILSQPALKYAYYLTLLTGLLYVLFSSKRKQREIEIEELSKNTSLDYVETTSSLFMAQNQNDKLVRHMKRNFFYKVKSTYFLNPDDPSFEEKLARKSKYPQDEISAIIRQLNLADKHSFNDDQLVRLFNDINSFDKNRK